MTHELSLAPHISGIFHHIRRGRQDPHPIDKSLAMVAGPGTVCLAASLPFRRANHDAMKAVKRTGAKIKVERE